MTQILKMTLVSLSLFLGMFSFFFGLLKISRSLNYDIHREIRRNFVRYAKVMPFVRYFGWSFSSKYYRLLIGWFEIILGALLAFCPGRTKQIANLLLICITFGAIYTHYAIEDDFNKMIPAIAFASMLITRLILYALVKRFENERNDDERLSEQKHYDEIVESIDCKRSESDSMLQEFGSKCSKKIDQTERWNHLVETISNETKATPKSFSSSSSSSSTSSTLRVGRKSNLKHKRKPKFE
ncbi:hypothetical protein NH340_JMT08292 [Sarcoptes scabiei]|nr:hypothetical protein NH340_JMT08292 [Sarcoptes scabiei]